MREIKFRCFDKREGLQRMIYLDGMVRYGEGWNGGDPIHKFWELRPVGGGFSRVCDCDYVFMQYTGLKDKNGKEIYEGDIVEIAYSRTWDQINDPDKEHKHSTAVGFVAWNEHATGWIIEAKSPMSVNGRGTVMTSIIHGKDGWIKVLGDIHQNHNLL